MQLEYIKANGKYWYPMKSGVQHPNRREGCFYPVCFIKQISNGRWQVDYFDNNYCAYKDHWDNQIPGSRIILYPSGIEEVKFSEKSRFDNR